ncbi:MAG: bifunctional enoyl-CoA hydratase/phosphate acetyltransferase [Bacteroidales bacterium]|nr:bifunctional enoyl-CoA hydratase/phosphate acetyltransferase [Bacteroidales bacterium]MCF8391740.1 bifunctional enoyl-CoA hydratase/phosphate acetyltransferase [Bacteroidales bacterium]
MNLSHLNQILDLAKQQSTKKLVVASSEDEHVLKAIKQAVHNNIIEPVFVGDENKTRKIAASIDFNIENFNVIDESNPEKAVIKAVKIVNEGGASILMKGMVSTATLLKAVLNKDYGLRKRETLSHFALFETSYYHKLVGITDAAMNISPELKDKIIIIENAAEVFHSLGEKQPKVAVLGPVEVVNPKIKSTVDAALLKDMYLKGEIKSCIVDGPLALDIAISADAVRQKGIVSEVAGNADILLAPDLNSGNILYKSMVFLSNASAAAVILGAQVPIVLTSRADSEKNKLFSIALAAII